MPLYEYVCDACHADFDEYLSITKFDPDKKPDCPTCHTNTNVRRVITRPPKLGVDPPKLEEHPRWKDVPVPDVPIGKDGVLQIDHNYGGLL